MLLLGFGLTTVGIGMAQIYVQRTAPADLARQWSTLFEYCRTVVELRQRPFALFGIHSSNGSPPNPNARARQFRWNNGDRLGAELMETGTEEMTTIGCKVVPTDWSRPFSEQELATLIYAYFSQRETLLRRGEHEAGEPMALPPMLMLSTQAVGLNLAGCRTIAYVAINTRDALFDTVVGEQPGSSDKCGAPPTLPPS